ncbi:hypothetical protein BC828DRAFT_65343 [Blastocladiella britannica]|nr:hypothetical protein BC828DRAFT_65343 [Blastocladiella britannica]
MLGIPSSRPSPSAPVGPHPRERQQYQQQRQLQQHPLLNRPLPPQPPPDEPVSPALAAIQRFVFAWASPQRIPHALDRAFQAAADPLQQAPPPKQGQDASDADAHSSSNSSSRNRWPLASPAASTLASQFADAWTRETATAIAAARHPSVMASTARTHWRLLVTVACLHLFTVACELGGLLLLALAVSRLGAPPLDTLESTRTLGALWPAVLAALIFGVRALLFSQQRFIASALKSRMATALSSAILSAATRVLVHVTPVPSTQVLAWVRSAAPAIGNGVTVLPILLLAPFELAAQLAVIACGFGAAGSVTAILVVVFVRAAALYARRAAKSTEMSAVANGRANLAAAEAEARQGARSIKINSWQPYIATRLRALAHAHFSTLTRLARKSALAASALSVTYPLALLVSVAAAQIAGNAVPPSAWTRVVAGLYFLCQTLSRIEFDTREVLRMRGACTTELTEFLVHGQEWPVFNTASEITSDTRPAQLMGSALPFSDAAYVVPDSNAILSIHGFSLSTATTAAVVAPPGGLDPGVLLAALAGELQTTTMPVATAPGTTSRGTTRSQASTLARSTAVSAAATGAPTGAAKGTTPNYLTGYVSTQPSVVPGTVRSNIVFGHPSASTMPDNDPWLARVAAVCGLDRVSAALPRGLDTLTSNLPRYIAARIAVARAVYARPSILLLDMAAFIGEDGDTRLSAETLRDIFAATALVPSAATLIAIQDLAAARSFADAVAIVQNDGHVSTPVSWDAARVTMERDAMSRAPLGGGNMSAADPEALWLSTFVAACRTRTLSNGISSSIPASSATLAGSSIPRSRSETHSGSIMTTGSIASSVGTMSRLAAQFSRGASAPSKLARNATVTSDTVSLIGSDDGVALQGSDPLTLVAAACLVPDDGRSPSSNKGIGVWASLSAMASFCLDADPHVLYLATVPVSLLVVYAASAAAAWSASTWTAAANTTMMVGWVAGLLAIAIVAAVAGSLACAHIAVHACEAGKVGDIQRTVDAPLQWHSTQARPPNGECAWDQIAMQLPQMALQLPPLDSSRDPRHCRCMGSSVYQLRPD